MKKVRTLAVIAALAVAVSASAQTKQFKHYQKGGYGAVELSSGFVFRNRQVTKPDYGIKMAGGYRFFPQLAMAIGFEGVNSMQTGTTCVPVFLQIRSDLMDSWISPLVQLETGWAFQVKHGTYDEGIIRHSGKQSFIDMRYWEKHQFSKRGPFVNLTLGAAFHLRREGSANIFLGVTGGYSSYYEGLWIRQYSNKDLQFATPGTLDDGTPAVLQGDNRKLSDRFLPELRFKIGICF